ncbi:UNVERIFIED_CONTAM: hypothetical protein Scaly_1808500 [Sesamum calycinum]|uniref:Uncharacterized protein n=1 Tax=Sesamum calycinum TaxID=2727403 RepID=A0AAW2NCJ8_9LAMI
MRTRMAEMRLVCEREIPIQQHRIDSLHTLYSNRFDSAKSEAQRTIQLQVKTRKEAKRMAIEESISVIKARVEELKGIVEDQRGRKNEYAAVISQQSEALTACKDKCNQNREHREQIEEAISWYNKVLGFRIECGHGIALHGASLDQDSSIVSVSAPVASVSSDHRYESPLKEKGLQFSESNSKSRKVGKGHIVHSPGSASSLRRSSRLKVTYMNMNRSMNG